MGELRPFRWKERKEKEKGGKIQSQIKTELGPAKISSNTA